MMLTLLCFLVFITAGTARVPWEYQGIRARDPDFYKKSQEPKLVLVNIASGTRIAKAVGGEFHYMATTTIAGAKIIVV